MRMNWMLTTAVAAMAITAAASAQSAKATGTSSKSGAMGMTYTGCVESVNHGAAYLLTDVHIAGAPSGETGMAMKSHDDRAMKGDAASKMQHEAAPMADPKMDAMAPKSFALAGSANINKHVGQKISVTGLVTDPPMETMHLDVSTLTVKSLKVIAKSCS